MKLRVKDMEIRVRNGTIDDIPLLLSFIRSMGEYEKLEVTATGETLHKSLFGENPAAVSLFAFAGDIPVAYVVYYFTFTTMAGKRILHLEDIYVIPEYRGKGIAKALMAYLTEIAIKNNCGRFEWIVLDWNKTAIDFYESLGAKILKDWRICRLGEENFARIAGELTPVDNNE